MYIEYKILGPSFPSFRDSVQLFSICRCKVPYACQATLTMSDDGLSHAPGVRQSLVLLFPFVRVTPCLLFLLSRDCIGGVVNGEHICLLH